jgi:ankyrin repeat protein
MWRNCDHLIRSSVKDLERGVVSADDASAAMGGRVARKGKQTNLRHPAKPGDVALDWSLVGEFINASVKEPDKAREMLKTNPGLLRARWRLDETPLHFLAIEGYLDGVRLLGQLGMDVNAVNEFGDTALTEVVTLGSVQMAEELLRLGADVNVTSKLRTNPLHCAMEGGRWDLAKLLTKAGARSDYTGPYGETFLDVLPDEQVTRDSILELLREQDARKV